MRSAALSGARAVLLAGPTALAFFAGGYFDEPRVWAGLVAWVLVAVAMLLVPNALPRTRGSQVAAVGLAAFAIWTLISFTWAPIAGAAYHAGQRVILYLGGLLAACALLRERSAARAVEPALAAGALVVIGYGISERLLPGLLHFQHSISAQGRLEQPLTYWNAMGELAALGFVLAVRITGDSSRGRRMRSFAAAASAPLGMGLYLTFSRGALFAAAAGVVTLVVVAPRRGQVRAIVVTVLAGALAAVAAAPFRGVTALAGSIGAREREGAITLALLCVITAAAGVAQWLMAGREREAELKLPRRAPVIALSLIAAGLAAAIVIGAKEKSSAPLSAGATRYVSLQSNRYAYWRVAVKAFRAEPLRGVGAGGWAVWWLRYRPINEGAQDAHSLPLQTLAELGVIGLALLAVFLAGVGWAALDALRQDPVLAAGAVAGFVTYLAHAPLDWDWQMPAVTLVGLALAGTLLAIAEGGRRRES